MIGDGAIFYSLRHSLGLVDGGDVADESSSYWLESPWLLEWKACQDRSFHCDWGSWWSPLGGCGLCLCLPDGLSLGLDLPDFWSLFRILYWCGCFV